MAEPLQKDDELLGARVREARIALNLTQKYLGTVFEVSAQQIAKFEAGKNRISAKMLYRLSILLNKPIEWFLQDLPDTDFNDYFPDTKQRFVNKATQYFNRIDDPDSQERLLQCLKILTKRKRLVG